MRWSALFYETKGHRFESCRARQLESTDLQENRAMKKGPKTRTDDPVLSKRNFLSIDSAVKDSMELKFKEE